MIAKLQQTRSRTTSDQWRWALAPLHRVLTKRQATCPILPPVVGQVGDAIGGLAGRGGFDPQTSPLHGPARAPSTLTSFHIDRATSILPKCAAETWSRTGLQSKTRLEPITSIIETSFFFRHGCIFSP